MLKPVRYVPVGAALKEIVIRSVANSPVTGVFTAAAQVVAEMAPVPRTIVPVERVCVSARNGPALKLHFILCAEESPEHTSDPAKPDGSGCSARLRAKV